MPLFESGAYRLTPKSQAKSLIVTGRELRPSKSICILLFRIQASNGTDGIEIHLTVEANWLIFSAAAFFSLHEFSKNNLQFFSGLFFQQNRCSVAYSSNYTRSSKYQEKVTLHRMRKAEQQKRSKSIRTSLPL